MGKNRKFLSIFLLLLMVFVPAALLAWFGNRMQQQEAAMIEVSVNKLVEAKLKGFDEQFQAYFQSLEQQLRDQYSLLVNTDTVALRNYLRTHAYVQNLYIASANGERLFPPSQQLSSTEQQFLQRTANLWLDASAFGNNDEAASVSQTRDSRSYIPDLRTRRYEQQALNERLLSGSALSGATESKFVATEITQGGWRVWYADAGINFIFWLRDTDDTFYAFELYPSRIISDLINTLPTPGPDDADFANASIQLLNERSDALYQWGGFLNEQNQHSLEAQLAIYLSHPLGSWKLNYFSDTRPAAQTQRFNLMLAVGAVTLVLLGLAIYFYREQQREIMLAQQRVNFVNQVSHELKTPLTNIRMYAELMDGKVDSNSDIHRHLNVITTESQRLSRLIENVLSFSRSQRKALKIHKQPGVVDALIESVLTAFIPVMNSRDMEIQFDGAANQSVYIDPEILEQILTNLLSNCEKYAADGKRVDISSQLEDKFCLIRVRDYGSGIDSADHERVFDAFYRVSSNLTDGVTGTGIGLGIARELARLHGGDLVIEGCDDNRPGTCFLLTLNIVHES